VSNRTYPTPPDGRYFVIRGRLWRASNPALETDVRELLVHELMSARRAVGVAKRAGDRAAETEAHEAVDRAKVALDGRGPVWWEEGAPDINRQLARTGPYADWYAGPALGVPSPPRLVGQFNPYRGMVAGLLPSARATIHFGGNEP
jgi:hypothetical protein